MPLPPEPLLVTPESAPVSVDNGFDAPPVPPSPDVSELNGEPPSPDVSELSGEPPSADVSELKRRAAQR